MSEKSSDSFCIRCGNRLDSSNTKDILCDKCKKETKTKEKDISPTNTIPQKDKESYTLKDINKIPIETILQKDKPIKTLLLKDIGAVTIPPIEDKKILKAAEDAVPIKWNKGDTILNLYEVKDSLGEGGMGKVHKVYHRGWRIDLAVKRPKEEALERAGGKEDFIKEAETWIDLGLHPNIVTCYYVRKLGGIPLIFIEYMEGGSLADWIRQGKLTELKDMLDVAIQFAWGLNYSHEQVIYKDEKEEKLVHKDVKPDNVLLTEDRIVKVTDFGLSKARGGMTIPYRSPEQAIAIELTLKTDIYSFAVSILEMFIGERTWEYGEAAPLILDEYIKGSIDIKYNIAKMPEELINLLKRCFQEDPQARPKDMLEISNTLQDIYQNEIKTFYFRKHPKELKLLSDSLNNKALSLLDLGNYEEAIKVFNQALETDTYHPNATYNLGLLLWRSGQMTDDSLVKRMREVSTSHSGDWLPFYLLGQIHLERADLKEAVNVLEEIKGEDAIQDVVLTLQFAKDKYATSKHLLRTFEGHKYGVNSVCLSTDNKYALSGSSDNTLKLSEIKTGRCFGTFEGHKHYVSSVCLSKDDKYALSGSYDNTLKLWEIKTGRCLRTFEGHKEYVNSVFLSMDNKYALSGSSDKTLKLWEIKTGRCLRTFEGHKSGVSSVCLSKDDKYALSGSYKKLKLWEIETGRCLRTFEGHESYVTSVCLSTDNKYALSGSLDYILKLWEIETGRCLRTFEGHKRSVRSVCLSTDNKYALSGSEDNTLKLWEIETGRCLRTFEGHKGYVSSVCLSADNKYALSGSWDYTLKLWKVDLDADLFIAPMMLSHITVTEKALSSQEAYEEAIKRAHNALEQNNALEAAEYIRLARSQPGYSQSSEALNEWSKLYIHLAIKSFKAGWEVATFEVHKNWVHSVCLSTDNKYALSGSVGYVGTGHTLKLWEIKTGRCLRTFEGHKSIVFSVCFSKDNKYALSGSSDKTLKLWEIETGKCLRTFEGHKSGVNSVCLSQDNKYALSGSGEYKGTDNTLKLWEIKTGRCLRTFEGHKHYVSSVCLSADNKYVLSGSYDNTLKLWEIETGRCLRTFEGHKEYVSSVCLSTDNKYALSGSGDKTLKLWEIKTGKCLRTFEGHKDEVNSVFLSMDNKYALSVSGSASIKYFSYDNTLKLWEIETGKCLRTFEGHKNCITSVCLSADNKYVLSGSWDNTLKLWQLEWELEDNYPADWDDRALPYLNNFLILNTPYAGVIPEYTEPTEEEINLALTRRGKPNYTEEDFKQLLYTLGCAGYGWLREEGVRKKLEEMTKDL